MNTKPLNPNSVKALLQPTSVALIGASDRSRWSSLALQNLKQGSYAGPVYLINGNGSLVQGQATAKRCAELNKPVDLGLIMVPYESVTPCLIDVAQAGARTAIILTSGFAEMGKAGVIAQLELAKTAEHLGVRLLGPNCLGFINFVHQAHVWTTPIAKQVHHKGVAIVSQSGATALFLNDLASKQSVGLSYVVSTGNEIDFDITDFVDYLVDDESTQCIALFAETFRRPDLFIQVAQRAMRAGKPIVILKAGAGEVSAKSAMAHTGSLVGDDRVFDGVCQQYGLIRTYSLDELLATAHVMSQTGVLSDGGLCMISNSGGVCEIAADTAEKAGMSLPEFEASIQQQLPSCLPSIATIHNPLDLTGAVTPAQCESIIECVAQQKNFAAILIAWYELPNEVSQLTERTEQSYLHISNAMNRIDTVAFVTCYTPAQVSDYTESLLEQWPLRYLACGVDRSLGALAKAMWWSGQYRHHQKNQTKVTAIKSYPGVRPQSEYQALSYLATQGVPTIPIRLVQSADEAVAHARRLNVSVVLKIASPDIAHKTEVGGVCLNLKNEKEIVDAYASMMQRVWVACPQAKLEGVLVAPMRDSGVELLVAMTRDLQWGPVILVGLGGVWVEILKDVAMRVLPVNAQEVGRMLVQLKAQALLNGFRGMPAVDEKKLCKVISHLGDAMLSLGDELETMEINPLWVRGDQIEALDALCVWNESSK